MNARTMLMLAAGAAASLAMADGLVPSVSNVAMAQADHSRTVTITYDLADAAAVVTLDVQTNRTGAATSDAADWVSIGGENVGIAKGDVWKKVEAGSRAIAWRVDKAWRGFKVSAARAVVTAWSVDNPPDYMVVNLAANAAANSETYYPAAEFLPGGLLSNSIYRTSQLVMRKIPAQGVTWEMGSMADEIGRTGVNKGETLHTVTFDDNYYIAVFETTQAQWSFVTNSWPSDFTGEHYMRPVEKVSYNMIRNMGDATCSYPADPHQQSFLGLLRAKTGLLFDLPSEAQWEFACRAGQGSGRWNDGSLILSETKDANLARLGRFLHNGGKVLDPSGEYVAADKAGGATNGTAIVGSYAPNGWGLYDMHGNVWEWCLDWYAKDITELGGAVNTTAGTERIRRGGGFQLDAFYSRSAQRFSSSPTYVHSSVGFRLALPVSSAATE